MVISDLRGFRAGKSSSNGWSATLDRELADARECRNHLLRDGCFVGPAFRIGLLEQRQQCSGRRE